MLIEIYRHTGLFKVNLEMAIFEFDLEIKYQFVLETGHWKHGFWNPGLKTLILGCWAKEQLLIEKKVQNLGLTAEPCKKIKD